MEKLRFIRTATVKVTTKKKNLVFEICYYWNIWLSSIHRRSSSLKRTDQSFYFTTKIITVLGALLRRIPFTSIFKLQYICICTVLILWNAISFHLCWMREYVKKMFPCCLRENCQDEASGLFSSPSPRLASMYTIYYYWDNYTNFSSNEGIGWLNGYGFWGVTERLRARSQLSVVLGERKRFLVTVATQLRSIFHLPNFQ